MGRQVTDLTLPYVHAFRDRHGRMRYYVRRKGRKRIPLPGLPGAQVFMEAYQAALQAEPSHMPKGGPRSLSALIQSFYGGPGFKNLSPSSQRTYRYILANLEARDGQRDVADLPDDKARKIIEEIGSDRPAMANLTCSVLRKLMQHAIKLRWRHSNPFKGIEPYKIGTHHTWTDKEIETYEKFWPTGTRERVAFDLLLYTAQRIGDMVHMKRSDIIKGTIPVTQQKTGTMLRIPIHPELQRSLNVYGIKGQFLVGRLDGRQIGDNALSGTIIRAAQKAGLPRKCVPHGIRKASLRILAERGMSAKVIAALSGHKTLREIERYTESADQARMAQTAVANLGK